MLATAASQSVAADNTSAKTYIKFVVRSLDTIRTITDNAMISTCNKFLTRYVVRPILPMDKR